MMWMISRLSYYITVIPPTDSVYSMGVEIFHSTRLLFYLFRFHTLCYKHLLGLTPGIASGCESSSQNHPQDFFEQLNVWKKIHLTSLRTSDGFFYTLIAVYCTEQMIDYYYILLNISVRHSIWLRSDVLPIFCGIETAYVYYLMIVVSCCSLSDNWMTGRLLHRSKWRFYSATMVGSRSCFRKQQFTVTEAYHEGLQFVVNVVWILLRYERFNNDEVVFFCLFWEFILIAVYCAD